jgi:hypothetical protein
MIVLRRLLYNYQTLPISAHAVNATSTLDLPRLQLNFEFSEFIVDHVQLIRGQEILQINPWWQLQIHEVLSLTQWHDDVPCF